MWTLQVHKVLVLYTVKKKPGIFEFSFEIKVTSHADDLFFWDYTKFKEHAALEYLSKSINILKTHIEI